MAIRLYNTLTRELEEFQTLEEGKVRIYICGLTVYADMHIGHARTYIAFDAIMRHLTYRGYQVDYVQNITDIDDKIINRAKEVGENPLELSKKFAARELDDQASLNLKEAKIYPKVSDHIPDIIDAIGTLIDKGYAYQTSTGVYYEVSRFSSYGKLSNQDTEQLTEHRIEPDPEKKSPLDFSLWKSVPEEDFGFASPWGFGRPGWHIECSVMSTKHLGERIDIHGGARDLVFPHHENEIAQTEALTGKVPFVRYWMHTGFLHSTGEKMSKSLGNIISVSDLLKNHSVNAFRLFILKSHYRNPIDYSQDLLKEAASSVERLARYRTDLEQAIMEAPSDGSDDLSKLSETMVDEFATMMDDDFNTPEAIAAIFNGVRSMNASLRNSKDSKESMKTALSNFDSVLSVLGIIIAQDGAKLTDKERSLIDEREAARANKDWDKADRIRDELISIGIRLKDQKTGPPKIEHI